MADKNELHTEVDFDSVDEQRRQDFESEWIKGNHPDLDDFLPNPNDRRFLGTLEEFVHIELEFLWKNKFRLGKPTPPKIEDYLARYPVLRKPDILARLLRAEFDLRDQFAKTPRMDEYATRFPELEESGIDLKGVLRRKYWADNVISGQQIGRYTLIEEHGKGGFGAVWRADDSKLGRRIALKRLSAQLARSSEARRQFVNEARVTAQLEHPGIVPIYDISNLDEDHSYYTMKLVRGQTLAQAIRAYHAFHSDSDDAVVEFQKLLASFLSVCQTIEYCHSKRVLHRDLKPQNIIVGKYGETIVLDWGLARTLDDEQQTDVENDPEQSVLSSNDLLQTPQTLDGDVKGTPAFMSPEQAAGETKRVDERSDVYALGVILYNVLTNQLPFPSRVVNEVLLQVQSGKKKAPRQHDSSIHPAIEAICLKAMHARYEDRYQSVAELISDIQAYLADEPTMAYCEPLRTRLRRVIRKNKTAFVSGCVAVTLLIVASIAGGFVYQKVRFEQANQIAQTRNAIENSEERALLQISSGRFEPAQKILEQAAELADGKTELESLAQRIDDRLADTSRIVRFYELGKRGQELTFFDDLSGAAIYLQEALKTIGAFENDNWWAHLPTKDLPPMERERLRTEVYRLLLLSTTMRIGETSRQKYDHSMLTQPAPADLSDPRITAALHTADLAEMYRPAASMQIARRFAKNRLGLLFMNQIEPYNPTDAAAMGSILDNNMPSSKVGLAAFQAMLNGREPRELAQKWLQHAVARSPEWYWIPIFVGSNAFRNRRYDEAIRAFSHGIGVEPDYWVGYMYRATAQVGAATVESDPVRIQQYLKAATIDLERAQDMARYQSELYWTQGYLLASHDRLTQQSLMGTQVLDSFEEALRLHPRIEKVRGGHFSGITKYFLTEAINYGTFKLKQDPENCRYLTLVAAAHLWSGQPKTAKPLIRTCRFV